MEDLRLAMATWLPFTLMPVLLVLLAPLAGQRARTAFAALLGVFAVAAAALALSQANEPQHLEVI